MRITAFPANDGDCFLLESGARRILVDGGRSGPFGEHALPVLAELPHLDALCVSHIDADHIEGILKMLKVEVDWQIFSAHEGDPDFRRPRNPRPCDFAEIWHNGFHKQIGIDTPVAGLPDDAADLSANLVTAMADLVTGTEVDAADYRSSYANLATSVPQALELVERLSDKQLDKKINERFDEELISSAVDPVVLDDLTVTFIGPTPETLAGLKQAWLDEFKKKQDVIDNLRERMADDVTDLATGSVDLAAVRAARADLAVELGLSEGELGDRRRITAPNLASLMFVAEECDHKAIFTGDGAGQDIIAGLQERNFLAPGVDSAIHVSVLKLQHHGSEFNVDSDFLRRVTADHYLISGNGNHENPDARVLEAIADSRDENHPAFAVAAEAADPFTIDMAMGPEVVTAAFEEALDGIFEELDRQAERFPADHMRIRRYEDDMPVVIELT